jgi:primosomal protein N' (replication factor Y)
LLSLDRPFTYDLPEQLGAGLGSLVQVPFHGRAARGWILGPTDDVPNRMLPVRKLVSPVRFFDQDRLRLLRWMAERYIAPLATVIGRSYPPRVASEEDVVGVVGGGVGAPGSGFPSAAWRLRPGPLRTDPPARAFGPLGRYRGGVQLIDALAEGSGTFVMRTAPGDEQGAAVEAVGAALGSGRTAIVVVPEAEPLPATARAVVEAFGERAALFVGGSKRARYRTWLEILAGRYQVVVGTRPAVFAPVERLGLVYVSRESHGGHREERSPAYHVRDVAVARARLEGGVSVLQALCPTAEAAQLGTTQVAPRGRWWPPVEVVRPGPEGRSPRLVALLRKTRGAFLYAPVPGAGVARVCRTCGEPAACAVCGGMLRAGAGRIRCVVCGADGRCAGCGSTTFGVQPGGAERVEDWARRIAPVPVRRIGPEDPPTPPPQGEVTVGGVEAVKDFGPRALDLVGVLDADRASRRPGLAAGERALAAWMEAASWVGPGGRVLVQTRTPNDPAVQALVMGDPERFRRSDLARRREAGFPPGWPVFRVVGTGTLEAELRALVPATLLVSGLGDETVCLLALEPGALPGFARTVRTLAERGVVTRVEAEPHL